MEETDCSERLVYKIQTPRNYPEESVQHYEFCLEVLYVNYLVEFHVLRILSFSH